MNAEILCVGTELLLGDTVNTNAAWLSRELAALGIGCYFHTVVGDNPVRLKSCLDIALARADMVITTGGLGPTFDDLTKETVAARFGQSMEMHQESLARIEGYFRRINHPMTKNNTKQALMPRGARVFPNPRGTAPGLALEGEGKIVIMLPGPPREMTAMFEAEVRPYLQTLSKTVLVSHKIHFFGIGESRLEHELRDFMEARGNPTIAPYAKEGEVLLRITAAAPSGEEAETLIRPVLEEIRERYAAFVYGIDAVSLQNALVRALLEKNHTLAVAEFFSGGLVSKRLYEVEGAEAVFAGGVCVGRGGWKGCAPGGQGAFAFLAEDASEEQALGMARAARCWTDVDIGCAVTARAKDADGAEWAYLAVSGPEGEKTEAQRLLPVTAGGLDSARYRVASALLFLALKSTVPAA